MLTGVYNNACFSICALYEIKERLMFTIHIKLAFILAARSCIYINKFRWLKKNTDAK